MGQATVDLPDPLQAPPVNASNTDDLLAQLAGEEIDRLLAEADTGAPPATPPSAPAAEPAGKSPEPVPVSATAPAAQPNASANSSVTSAELDDLLGQLDVAAPPAAQKGTLPVSAAPAPVPQQAVPQPVPEEHPVAAEMDEDARMTAGVGALAAPVIAAAKGEAADLTPKVSRQSTGLPIYYRPLEWVNAPLSSCPDQVRDTIGKIAILTTVNALSVLAYVLIFRAH